MKEQLRIEKFYSDESEKEMDEIQKECEEYLASLTEEQRWEESMQKKKEAGAIIRMAEEKMASVDRILDAEKIRRFQNLIPKVLDMAQNTSLNLLIETKDSLMGHIKIAFKYCSIIGDDRYTFSEMSSFARDVSGCIRDERVELDFWYELYREVDKNKK